MKFLKIFLFLFLGLIYKQTGYAQSTGMSSFDTTSFGKSVQMGRYVKIRGFKMYYEIYGDGEPLLLIHGNGKSIRDFINQIPFFAKRYTVIVADSRAQGRSYDDRDSLSYEMMADDYDALLTTLKIESCNVLGWSDGGINGLLLAIRHPEKVKKLAITGANLWPDTSAVTKDVFDWALNYNEELKNVYASPEIKTNRKLAHLMSYAPHISVSQLRKIKCPTLVIAGDHDIILTKHTVLIAESISNSYLWIMPNSGHSTPIFYKEQFNEGVYDFFRKPYRKIEGMDRAN